MKKLECLVLGGSGQIGTALRHLPWPADVDLYIPSRTALDLGDETALADAIASKNWGCVINAAAFTLVDAAEVETSTAWRVNAQAPGHIATATARAGIPLLHLSTDYVFGGTSADAHGPTDKARPINVYGASKAAGEQAVRKANAQHVILRTSWVISPFGANFVKTILRLAATQSLLKVVDDQRGRPTSATDLAKALQVIALRLTRDSTAPTGTYHFANAGTATWYEIAQAVVARARQRGLTQAVIEAISSEEYPTPARRPSNSTLCTKSLELDFGIAPRHWREALDEILEVLLSRASPEIVKQPRLSLPLAVGEG